MTGNTGCSHVWKKYALPVFFFIVSAALPTALQAAFPSANISGGHRGAVTSVIHNKDSIITAGEDGCIVYWNVREKAAKGRFQLTNHAITAMVKHPQTDEICVIEAGGMDQHWLSVWNYKNLKKLFSLESAQEITFVNYSAGGSFVIVGGFNGQGVTLLDSRSGRIVSSVGLTGTATLAITGKADRNMLVYQSRRGLISYMNLNPIAETGSFQAPGGLKSPVLFDQNRYLAGIDAMGLVLVDAASGEILDSNETISGSALLFSAESELYCINPENNRSVLYRFAVDNRGSLIVRQRLTLVLDSKDKITAAAFNGSVVLATEEGELLLVGQNGNADRFAHNEKTRITEIAASRKDIAFLTENGELCLIPLDYRQLRETYTLTSEKKDEYTRISFISGADRNQFLVWQTGNTRHAPVLKTTDRGNSETVLTSLSNRFPLRSVSSHSDRILFLDMAGNVSVYNVNDLETKASFTFSSAGAIDAAFINRENVILCRSVISGNSPFLIVNLQTGETLPLPYSSKAGIMVYTGDSGNIYAAAVEQHASELKTAVLVISASRPERILEFPGEEPYLCAAESSGRLAVASDRKTVLYGKETIDFERTEGLTVKILGCPDFFVSLDSAGAIAWHDNRNGKLLAVFELYKDKWTLTGSREITGAVLTR